MVELLLIASLFAGPSERCTGGDLTYGCTNGSITDDGARLDGSIHGRDEDANSVDVDGGGDEPEEYCARQTGPVCDFAFTITPPPAEGAVTLADVAAFQADAGTVLTEPNGWAVLGLPLNAISTAATHTVDGTLLGQPASVRFTPTAWVWNFGDGTRSITTATSGATWADLRVPEFDPTATSHIYTTRGNYRITVDVRFTVEYRIGTGAWTPIPGTLTLPATAPSDIRAIGARTVLVADNCNDNPRGPGC